jgi:serine/threonine protein kinase
VGFPVPDLGSIGPYRLIRKLGEGGMGQVWLAEQSAPVNREIALKIIKAGRYDKSALIRFDLERQALATMDHPAIAKVFDAGSTAEDQPYFAMEYVPGLPITEYCDEKRLSPSDRLVIFTKVCEGVQHAHQKAIIHRDLKPTNILVVEVDGKPTPRIIDFGLAKAISQQSQGGTLVTRDGGLVGTPGYMSPEQMDPMMADVDTRADVYSLGVVLYELLTGVLALDAKQWESKPFHEVLRQLHEEEPTSPSTRIRASPAAAAIAEKRSTDPRQLAGMLRGDLDWITLKALERDRARRYGTPSELAADINRYLRNEPVIARPASAAYRAKKYVQRHKFGVAFVTAMAMLLMAFGVMQAIQLRRIMRERDRADRVTQFMTGMFKVSDPSEARGDDIRAREILDKASNDIDTGPANDPELQAQMMNVMGSVYQSLGLTSKAEPLLRRAVKIRQRALGPRNPDTLQSKYDLAELLTHEGHYPEAEKLCRETLDGRRSVLGPGHRDTLSSMTWLGWILFNEGHYSEAEKLYREAIEVAGRALGPQDKISLTAKNRAHARKTCRIGKTECRCGSGLSPRVGA